MTRAFMRKAVLAPCAGACLFVATGVAAFANDAPLTAEQIVAKNVESRGGLDAWRGVESITVYEHAASELSSGEPEPVLVRMKRPAKKRVDTQVSGGYITDVFDGHHGWKVHISHGRDPKVEVFNGAEVSRAIIHEDLDSPLIDYAAKGNTVELEGSEVVEGRAAWRLKLTQQGQFVRHVWIDAQSFLEMKIEEFPRIVNNQIHPVNTYFSDYRTVEGLLIPFRVDTKVEGTDVAEHTVVDRIGLNSKLDNMLFVKPRTGPHAAGPGMSASNLPARLQP